MSLVKSSIMVSALSLLISVVSFVNQIVIASFFGAGNEMDLYLLASSIPLMFAGILSSALSYSLIPHFIKKEVQFKENFKEYLGLFCWENAKYIISLGIVFALLFYLLIPIIYPSLVKEDVKIVRIINFISWGIFLISILFSFISCSLIAKKNFTTPIILSLFPYVFAIISTSLLYDSLGVVSVSLGGLIGSFITFGIGFLYVKNEIVFFKNIPQYKFEINHYLEYIKYPVFAMLTFTVYQSIDSFWAPKLGESALSYLGYSQRIITALCSLVIIGPSTVLIPRLTISIEEGRTDDYFKDASMILKMVLALGSTMAVIGIVLSKSIIEILFERGEFNSIATNGVSEVFSYMLVGLVFMLCVVIAFRILFTRKLGVKIALIGLYCTLLYFVLSGVLSSLFGVIGISLAYIFTWALVLIITINTLFKDDKSYFFNNKLYLFLGKQLASLTIMFFVCFYLSILFELDNDNNNFLTLLSFIIIIGFTSFGLYCFLSVFVFQVEEIIFLFDKTMKRTKKLLK